VTFPAGVGRSPDTYWGYHPFMSEDDNASFNPAARPVGGVRRSPAPLLVRWLAVAAGSSAIVATYWDGAWHTAVGRDSALEPPHLLLYSSLTVAAAAVGVWALITVVGERSIVAVFRRQALLLSLGALVGIAASAGLDVLWHDYFGRDAVLWSPPHLLSVIASLVVIIGLTASGADERRSTTIGIGLGTVVLATAMVPVMEYDSRVPQFTEIAYLPIVVVAGLFAAWVIDFAVAGARVMAVVVSAVVVFRTVIWAVLAATGWPTVDIPFALLGLAVLDLPVGRRVDRIALAAVAMSVIQLLVSATGLSSVALEAVIPAAVAVLVVAVASMLVVRRIAGARVAAVALLVLGAAAPLGAPPAQAHDPGQGADRGEIRMSVDWVGSRVAVLVEPVSSTVPIEFDRIVARRAGEVVEATIEDRGTGDGIVRASIELDGGDLWFVYAEFSSPDGTVESWITVESGESNSGVRPLYEPPTAPVTDPEFLGASVALYLLAAALLAWAVRVVAMSKRRLATAALT
jgi:hypothetical protein